MNAKQAKTLWILVGIVAVLAALFAAVLIFNHHKAQQASQADSSAEALGDSGATYTGLTYTNSTATLTFSLNKDGTWYWEGNPKFPLNSESVTMILNSISVLTPKQTITNGDTLEAYGLDNPAITMTASESNGIQTTIAMGNQTADKTGYYLLLNGDTSTVYVVDENLHDLLSKGIYDMMTLPNLPVLPAERVSSISLAGAVQTDLTASVTTAKADSSADSSAASSQSSTTVTWRADGTDVTDNQTVQELVSEVCALNITACADYEPTDQAASLCGFDQPRAVLTVQYTDDQGASQSYTLTFANADTSGEGCYVRMNNDTTIYTIKASGLKTLLSAAANGISG